MFQFLQSLKDLVVEASNNPGFQDADTLSRGLDISAATYAEGRLETTKAYRYWRVSRAEQASLAELSFIDKQGNPLTGSVARRDSLGFDRNPLTNLDFSPEEKIIIDFNTPVHVSKVICLPRGDGNGIYPRNDYELFYHGLTGWQSLGRQVAVDYHLEYDNVPRGALLWLHNHTTGVEERIFTREEGEVRFW